jgi:hypothetical protein
MRKAASLYLGGVEGAHERDAISVTDDAVRLPFLAVAEHSTVCASSLEKGIDFRSAM